MRGRSTTARRDADVLAALYALHRKFGTTPFPLPGGLVGDLLRTAQARHWVYISLDLGGNGMTRTVSITPQGADALAPYRPRIGELT